MNDSQASNSIQAADTVLARMIPCVRHGAVSTVSNGFRLEIIGPNSDPVQTEYFAPHLHSILREKGLVTTRNGMFGKSIPPFSREAVAEAQENNPRRILREKLYKRAEMLRVISEYEDSRIIGRLDGGAGRPLMELPEDVPVYLMTGRLDPGQKGFDVKARAIENLPRGRARFVLIPDVGSGATAFLADLARLATWFPGEVIIFPFRMVRGYKEIMGGSTWAVSWSLYEPFGAITEPYLAGTPVVARDTGGTREQISAIGDASGQPTGLVAREALPRGLPVGENWRQIMKADDPDQRMTIPLYRAMVSALREVLIQATDIYRDQRDGLYATMLASVFYKAMSFPWTQTADECKAIYDAAINRS